MAEWTKESVYDEQINPLMTKIIAICNEHEIPLVCTFQYGEEEGVGALFCTTVLTNYEKTHVDMLKLARGHGPKSPFLIAETIATDKDGKKHVTIKRVL